MPRQLLRCLLLGFLFVCSRMAGIGATFADWTLAGGAPGKTAARDGFLEIIYESPKKAPLTLRPAKPVALPDDVSRLRLWFAAIDGDCDLTLLIADASGREHRVPLETSRYLGSWQHPRQVLEKFSRWYQADSNLLAPTDSPANRVQPEFMEKAKAMLWPRPLTLVGLVITPVAKPRNALGRAEVLAAGRGKVCLGPWDAIAFDGLTARSNWFLEERGRWGWETTPVLFPDDLSTTAGTKHYRLELRRGFQGPVIWTREGNVDVRSDDAPGLFNKAIPLPVPPQGRYFLEARVWTSDGTLEDVRWMQLYSYRGADPDMSGVNASVEWRTSRENHVFSGDEPGVLSLHMESDRLAALPPDTRCEVTIRDWQERVVYTKKFSVAPENKVVFTEGKPGEAYVIEARLRSGNRLLDRTQLMFGFRNAKEPAAVAVPDSVPGRDGLIKGQVTAFAEHWGEYFQHYGPICPPIGFGLPATPERVKLFDDWMRTLPGLGFDTVAFYFNRGMIEPLPGVVQWSEMDRRVALAAQLGLRVVLTPTSPNSNPYREPIWSSSMPVLDQYGYTLFDTQSKLTWPGSWSMTSGYFEFLRSLATHFSGNAAVVGYSVEKLSPRDRETYETKSELRVADYSLAAQVAYEQWRASRGLKPSLLAKRFVLPGDDNPSTGPDLSEDWQRTMEFRAFAGEDWVKRSLAAIRAVDPRRTVMIYQMSTMANVIPSLRDGGVLLPEGGPNYNELYVSSMLEQAGLPYAHEASVFVPTGRGHIDGCYFYASCFGDEAVWKFRWNQESISNPRFSSLAPTLAYWKDSLPAFREWYAARRVQPEVLVLGSHINALLDSPRRIALPSLAGFEEFVALYQYHQVPAHFANEFADWVDLDHFQLVVVAGDVMRQSMIKRLSDYVDRGGKVLISGKAGRFVPEQPESRNTLAKVLADKPQVRRIESPAVAVEKRYQGVNGHAATMFDAKALNDALAWAGIKRKVEVNEPGFDVLIREGKDSVRYVALFRRLLDGKLVGTVQPDELVGTIGCTLTVSGLSAPDYRIETIHRKRSNLGTHKTETDGSLTFSVEPMEQGEMRLFRLIPQ